MANVRQTNRALQLLGVFIVLVVAMGSVCLRAAAPATVPSTAPARLPLLIVCGDSTAHNQGAILGWGDIIGKEFFDPTKITVQNHAQGGRSSRTFIQEGRWETVRKLLKPGDFVLIQFGHNDTKAQISMDRYSLPGLGDESEEGTGPNGQKITIKTFGFYMRQMVTEAQATGATPIVLSPVPRNSWTGTKVKRQEQQTGDWAKAVALEKKAPFVDVNTIIGDKYEVVGQTAIKALYFPQDNTHTSPSGAKVNAACVVLGILDLQDVKLKDYLIKDGKEIATKAAEIPKPTTKPAATATAPATPG